MKQSVRFGAPNLMFFVEDASGGTSPVLDDTNVHVVPRFWVNSTTLIVGALHRDDGDTTLTVSTSEADAPLASPRFDCQLPTPSRLLQFSTSERELVMEIKVVNPAVRIRVWSNDPRWPDDVFILVS